MASDQTEVMYFRAPVALKAAVKAAAQEDRRSAAKEAAYLIELGLAAREQQKKDAAGPIGRSRRA